MGNYRIITDSTADLTPELIQELDVQVLPLCYMMGGRVYHNIPGGGEMTEQAFYAKLRAGTMSTTTQVNSEEFLHVFTPLLEGGRRRALHRLFLRFEWHLSKRGFSPE